MYLPSEYRVNNLQRDNFCVSERILFLQHAKADDINNSISMLLFYDFLFGKEMGFELGHEISAFSDFWLSSLYTQASNFNYSFESEKHTIE